MNLTEILADAAGGFLSGFGLGISGFCDRLGECIKVSELTLTKEERIEAGFTDKKIGKAKFYEKMEKVLLPSAAGLVYSLGDTIFNQNSPIETMAIAVPSAYIGRVVGGLTRKIVKIGGIKDLEISKNIMNDPEHALDYIPKGRREIIESSLGDIERGILAGEELCDNELKGKESPTKEIGKAIMKGNRLYVPALFKWCSNKIEEVYKIAGIQREITEFYENQNPIGVATLGPPENTSLIIYEIDKNTLKTYGVTFNELRMVKYDRRGIRGVDSNLEIELKEKKDWRGDYKGLAKEIGEVPQNYTPMLIKAFPNMSDSVRTKIIIETFLTGFIDYQKEKSAKGDPKKQQYDLRDSSHN